MTARPAPNQVAEPASIYQLRLPMEVHAPVVSSPERDIETALACLLTTDLTFKGQKTNYATHNLHAFAAKFPPQLPKAFISQLTHPGETVLDPMSGSGTTVVEALLAGRNAIGTDIDPLATLLTRVKSRPADLFRFDASAKSLIARIRKRNSRSDEEIGALDEAYSPEAVEFFRYWFEESAIRELFPLAQEIMAVPEQDVRAFLQLVFSSVIITKSGGLTRARDLAHSRPHRDLNKRVTRSAWDVFEERVQATLENLATVREVAGSACILRADARRLPLLSDSVHLIVTSPPYAANAIDYMRAHKFSLIWFGHPPKELSRLRSRYIGAELRSATDAFPSATAERVLHDIRQKDERRASSVAHYFSDLQTSLREMLRVLCPGRAAVLVVGSSTISGVGIKVPAVTAELAEAVGFRLTGVAHREIVRDARMMPVSHQTVRGGIEARMHEEGVIGLIKPCSGENRADAQ